MRNNVNILTAEINYNNTFFSYCLLILAIIANMELE